jgi:hypothetical protein
MREMKSKQLQVPNATMRKIVSTTYFDNNSPRSRRLFQSAPSSKDELRFIQFAVLNERFKPARFLMGDGDSKLNEAQISLRSGVLNAVGSRERARLAKEVSRARASGFPGK